ncbi:MAG: hypothetical protein U0V72_12685 [Cytophagales bacterium]
MKAINVFFILFLGWCYPLPSQDPIVDIPDSNFKATLLSYVPQIDLNADHEIQKSEAEGITNLQISNHKISDLRGIENFIALKFLNCSANNLTYLDLSKNLSLTTLLCSYNFLSDLDLSHNTALVELQCNSNHLNSLNVSLNKILNSLNCSKNHLSSLDLSQNLALKDLYCGFNLLGSMDISQNIELMKFYCNSNRLTNLDLSFNPKLIWLGCFSNRLSTLDLSNTPNLQTLYCQENFITVLDLTNNLLLKDIDCSGNLLNNLDVQLQIDLIYFACNINPSLEIVCINNTQRTILNNWYKDEKTAWESNCGYTDIDQESILPKVSAKLINILTLQGKEVPLNQAKRGIYLFQYSDGNVYKIFVF